MNQQPFQIKRGNKANFAGVTLASGELAFILDEGKLYIGDGTNKVLINPDLGTAADKNTGTASGEVPVLNAEGKLDVGILPDVEIVNPIPVANEAAMLALDAQPGDVALRADNGKAFMLFALPASTKSNWKQISAEIVTKESIGLGSVDNTADADKAVASAAKLTAARTITLTGAVTGTVSFDGSGNVTINTEYSGNIDCGTF